MHLVKTTKLGEIKLETEHYTVRLNFTNDKFSGVNLYIGYSYPEEARQLLIAAAMEVKGK